MTEPSDPCTKALYLASDKCQGCGAHVSDLDGEVVIGNGKLVSVGANGPTMLLSDPGVYVNACHCCPAWDMFRAGLVG